MPTIILTTTVNAPIEKVFDLARSIDLHQQSMAHTHEKAVGGKLSGLINKNEIVTWEARHLFMMRKLTSKIVEMTSPSYFKDVMIEGDFSVMEHDHYFKSIDTGTQMKDVFFFKVPYGLIGMLAGIFLKHYLSELLKKRNHIIK
jgi:ligand-binding SRPBCC domain-containing protein